MSDSRPWINVPPAWVDIYALTGISPGTALEVCNMGNDRITICVSAAKPTTMTRGIILSPINIYGMAAYVDEGASGLWAITLNQSATLNWLAVQDK